MWKCEECGSIHRSAQPPEVCPGCDTPREQFCQVNEEAPPFLWESRSSKKTG